MVHRDGVAVAVNCAAVLFGFILANAGVAGCDVAGDRLAGFGRAFCCCCSAGDGRFFANAFGLIASHAIAAAESTNDVGVNAGVVID